MTAIVKKLGGSLALVIPKALAREAGLNEGAAVEVTAGEGTLVVRRQGRRPRRPLSTLMGEMKPAAYKRRRRELPDGGPVGREVW
jgi:antitoxin component of MazEF toxin-antitoxin module